MKRIIISLLCAGALFCGCGKDNDGKKGDDGKNYQASNFFKDNLKKMTSTFSKLVVGQERELQLPNGMKVNIPAGDVFTKNGTPISGEYTVEVAGMLKPSEMIRAGGNTNFRDGQNDRYLISDGFLCINVLHGGESVDPTTRQSIRISVPTDKEDGEYTFLWLGEVNDDGEFAWVRPNEEEVELGDETGERNMAWAQKGLFSFQSKKLGWINCDVFWYIPGTQVTLRVTLSGLFGEFANYMGGDGDTFVFFKVKDINVLAQLYTRVNGNAVMSYENSIPEGVEGTLIAFYVKDGVFSCARKQITIGDGDTNEDLELVEVTKEDFDRLLDDLDK
jgi:hypothetical protein